MQKFPCFALAKRAMCGHFLLPTVFNAVNEVAVKAFLNQEISFNDIAILTEEAINHFESKKINDNLDNKNLNCYLDVHDDVESLSRDLVASLNNNKKAS